MFRRAVLLGLVAVSVLTLVADANACHRCGRRRGYSVSGCGYSCHSRPKTYKVAKVYRTYKVPVQTCSTCCVTVTDPCNPCCTKTVPMQTCTTTYVTKKVLVHTQRVAAGPVYGNFTDGSHRVVWGGSGYGYGAYGRGYSSPYRTPGYGLGGGYRMGGYGAASDDETESTDKEVESEKVKVEESVALAF